MVASDSFAEFLREQLAPLGRVTLRLIFGKTGAFCDGVMFGVVSDNMLYLRLDDRNRTEFEEALSSPLLSYEKKGSTIDLAFCRTPERLFDEPEELLAWARRLHLKRRAGLQRSESAHLGMPRLPFADALWHVRGIFLKTSDVRHNRPGLCQNDPRLRERRHQLRVIQHSGSHVDDVGMGKHFRMGARQAMLANMLPMQGATTAGQLPPEWLAGHLLEVLALGEHG